MTSTIKSKRQVADMLFTTVEYVFTVDPDSIAQTIEVDVSHYQPQTIAEINTSIANRGESELRALLAAKKIQDELITQL